MNVKDFDVQSKQMALAKVRNMLPRPGQLEKLPTFKQRYMRKKTSVEALLKSAMQSQLNGVREGFNILASSQNDMRDVERSLKSMGPQFESVPALCKSLAMVRDENMKHSQYVTAKENLKHIFTVPESVEKTKEWINNGQLLHSHQCLRDLENSRDDLLFELHKYPNQSPHDTAMLKAYFAEVQTLSHLLEQQLRLNLSQTLNAVRKMPTVIVTAMRITVREERSDAEALRSFQSTGFLPPDRPKAWKKMAFDVLERSVATRIEGTQIDGREDNKLWLIRYLELIRLLILEDLRVVKALCVPRFPPYYNIVDRYIEMYHNCLSSQLNGIIENGLEGNEYVTILSWTLNTYKGPEMMGHPDLIEHTSNLGPLLKPEVMLALKKQYLSNMENNYKEWMQKTLQTEQQEWRSNAPPSSDQILRTSGPSIIFEMIGQNLDVTKTINQSLTDEALFLSLRHVEIYGKSYRDAINEFKNDHFKDRSQVLYFTQYMIATINNCYQLIELGAQFLKKYGNASSGDMDRALTNYKKIYMELRHESGSFLLEEAFLDLDKHFEELFTVRWIKESLPVDTIRATLEDYFLDYNRLVEENFQYVMNEARDLVAKRYIVSMLSRKVTFRTYDECQSAAAQITREARKLQDLFTAISSGLHPDDPLEIIVMLAEVLRCENDMLSLDLHSVVEKYPDITEDHLMRLLYLRGDLPRAELRDKVGYVVKQKVGGTVTPRTIFTKLVLPKSLIHDIKSNIP